MIVKSAKIFLVLHSPQTALLHLEQTKLVHIHFALLGFFPICNNIIPIIDQCRFFYFWDRPWYSDEWDRRLYCTTFIPWTAWILLNFYLKQKQRFSAWSLTENTSLVSFHRGIWSRYSQINKFKISKDLSFQKEKKNTLKMYVSKQLQV